MVDIIRHFDIVKRTNYRGNIKMKRKHGKMSKPIYIRLPIPLFKDVLALGKRAQRNTSREIVFRLEKLYDMENRKSGKN